MRRNNVMEVLLAGLTIHAFVIALGETAHPGCECLIFSSTFGKEMGNFKSPDFPKPYPPNIDCLLYTFVGRPDQIVEITFLDFDVRKTNLSCIHGDHLKLFLHLETGHQVNEYTPWTSVLCGRLSDTPTTIFYSSAPGLVLEFHSGSHTRNATGFSGNFRFIDRRLFRTDGQKIPNTVCDYQFVSTAGTPRFGKFYSPRYPSNYLSNIRCSYRFRARSNESIRVSFEEVKLQKGDISCLNRADILRVYDGKSTNYPIISIVCNEGGEQEIFSTGSDLFIEFIANSELPGQGFKANFQFQSGNTQNYTGSNCNEMHTSDINKNGTIMSPSYPLPYPAKTTCSYQFQGRGKERVQIVFQDFNLYHPKGDSKECDNQDSLTAFVHIESRMEKLDNFCGSSLPKPVMSNGPRLKLEFRSFQVSRYSRGFKATYSFVKNFGIRSGAQLSEYPCAFVYNSNESRTGIFHSPNYPGFYPRDTECHYFFQGGENEKVHLHFNYFDVEGVSPCDVATASDYVEFSNFVSTDRKYFRHCGQFKEFDIESDRKFFRVTFRSNDRLDGTGFNATYQFLDEVELYTAKSDQISSSNILKGIANAVVAIVLLQSICT